MKTLERPGPAPPASPVAVPVTRTGQARPGRLGPADLLLPLALALWAFGVATTHLSNAQGSWGLVGALSWAYWAGLAVLLGSSTVQLARRQLSTVRLAIHVAALIFMVQAVFPLLYPAPRYFWQFKAVGETQYMNLHGRLNPALDIYQRWPGFFGLAAWFDKVAGIASPLSYLAWTEVFFDLLFVSAFAFAIVPLGLTRRERWTAVFLFFIGDWVAISGAQDFFTPQAIGFIMALVALGVILRWFEHRPWWRTPLGRVPVLGRLVRLVGVDELAAADRATGGRLPRSAAVVILLVVYVPLVFTHPFSPVMVLLLLSAVFFTGVIKPLWVILVMTVLTAGYILSNLSFLQHSYKLLGSVGNVVANSAPPTSGARQVGPNHYVIPLLTAAIFGLAGVGAWSRRRSRRGVLTLSLMSAAPFVTIGLVHYGTETLYRALLFALPSMACLGACFFWSRVDGRTRERRAHATRRVRRAHRASSRLLGAWLAGLVLLVTAPLAIIVNYSQSELYEVAPADIQAAAFFYQHASPGVAIYVNGNFPLLLGANYDQFEARGYYTPYMGFYGRLAQPAGPLAAYACGLQYAGHEVSYIILSDSQFKLAEALGGESPALFVNLQESLQNSAYWRVFYQNSTTEVFENVSGCSSAIRALRPTSS